MGNNGRARWALGLAVALAATTAARAEPWRHGPTGVSFPDQLAGMERSAIADVEARQAGGGVAVTYRAPDFRATVYLYTAGKKEIPADLRSPLLRRQLEQTAEAAVRFGQMSGYVNIRQPPPRTSVWDGIEPEIRSMRVSLRFEHADVERVSHLHLTAFRDHFLLVRITFDRADPEDVEPRHERVLTELAALLRAAPASGGDEVKENMK